MGGLAWSVAGRAPPEASLADAARWEGQTVAMEGWAADVRPDGAGMRLRLVDGAHAVDVRVEGNVVAPVGGEIPGPPGSPAATAPADGDRVRAVGRLSRWQGALRLEVEAGDLLAIPGPAPATPSREALAADPAAWSGRLVRLSGEVADGWLVERGHGVAIGRGAWPGAAAGLVSATGLLRYDGGCLCHRLDAREVQPWTS